jgi:universal stress protein E
MTQRRYKSILGLVDAGAGGLRAVEMALDLAAPFGGRVTAARVIDLSETDASEWSPDGWGSFKAELVETELSSLSARIRGMQVPGVRLNHRVMMGRPSLEVIRDVLEQGHDLVVKVAAGAVRGRRVAFGTTGLHLVRKCPAPVWLLPPRQLEPKRLLAAVNPGIEGDEARYALCERVLSHACTLARALGAELHVVYVHEPPRATTSASLTAKLAQRVALTEGAVLARVERCLASLDARATVHALRGDPEEVLPMLTDSMEVHSLVIGSIGRSGIEGLLIGDLAEELLLRVSCGVFCVKPAGFRTIVRGRSSPQPFLGELR